MQKRLLFILNEPTYFISHRLPIAIAARNAGYEVHVATGARDAPSAITLEGFQYHSLPLSRSGRNIFVELKSILVIYRLIKKINPHIVHLVTIKPVIYGCIAARFAKVPAVIAAVSGLGYAFIDQYVEAKILKKIVSQLYCYAFRHPNLNVIFQNQDDQNTLTKITGLSLTRTTLIPGSGVDLNHYQYTPEPENSPPIAIMAARLLRDKGIYEYIAAAKILRKKGVIAKFWLAGQIDHGNPSSVTAKQLKKWQKEGYIEYLGHHDNIPKLFSKCNLVVLPSYREGLPRVLSEAAACGRAVVTTDVPGCRSAIIPQKTGLLVNVRDAVSLANALEKILTDKKTRHEMGMAGRKLAEEHFNIQKIITQHMLLYQKSSKPNDA